MRKLVCGVLLNAIAIFVAATAWAASCTDHYDACVRNETRIGKAASRCERPLRACLAACRANKPAFFVGPSTGRKFPASTCG